MTDLNKLRSEFEALPEIKDKITSYKMDFVNGSYDSLFSHINAWMDGAWFMFQEKAKAQAVPEHIVTLQRNGEVFKFDLLDLLRRSLKSSKVLKTRENWSHVSKMVGIGSTTATLLCKEMNVDPDGTVFVASESGAEK
ncbi:hypothetical protein ACT4VL_10425 [Acinetobacter baumannii]